MYAALWRILPGPVWLRALLMLLILAAVCFILISWVFPWVELIVGGQEVTVGTS